MRYFLLLYLLIGIILSGNAFCTDSTLVLGNLYAKKDGISQSLGIHALRTEGFKLNLRDNASYLIYEMKVHELNALSSRIDYKMLSGLSLFYVAGGTYLHIAQSNSLWNESKRFYLGDNGKRTFNFDKFAHFYSVNLLGHLFSGGYEASGMQSLESTWFSSLSALAYNTYVNLESGFHKGDGFSVQDMAVDFLGTGFYISQYYLPVMKNFQPKVSYWPSEGFKIGSQALMTDDFSAQKYWLAVRVKNFMPSDISQYWPAFLNIAAGTAVRRYGEKEGKSLEFYLALDLNAEELPLYGPFWQFIKNTLNYVHFPMPGVRISPDKAAFLLCF